LQYLQSLQKSLKSKKHVTTSKNKNSMEYIINTPIFFYVLSVVLASWFINSQILSIQKKYAKMLVTVITGLILGVIWKLLCKSLTYDLLLFGFVATSALYDYLLKFILKKFE